MRVAVEFADNSGLLLQLPVHKYGGDSGSDDDGNHDVEDEDEESLTCAHVSVIIRS
jgi:hypothetical protein